MWLTLPYGFFSIAVDPEMPTALLIRARMRRHLVRACKAAGIRRKIEVTPERDYRYRVRASRLQVAKWIARHVGQIDYANFKDAAHAAYPRDENWEDALSRVWITMYGLQGKQEVSRWTSPNFDWLSHFGPSSRTSSISPRPDASPTTSAPEASSSPAGPPCPR